MFLGDVLLFQEAFNLPMNSSLYKHSNTDSTSPNEIMGEMIIQIGVIYAELGIPFFDSRQFLGWDSRTIKDHLHAYFWLPYNDSNFTLFGICEGYCPHTERLVEYAHKAFDIDVILGMYKNTIKRLLSPLLEAVKPSPILVYRNN